MNDLLAVIRRDAMLALIGVLLVVAGFAYCAGQRHAVNSISEAALRDTIRLTDSVVRVQTDTLIVYRESSRKAKAASDSVKLLSDSLDRLVVILNDSTVFTRTGENADSLNVRDSTQTGLRPVVIPVSVVADLRALRLTVAKQDTTIHWLTVENRSLWMRDTTRMQQIEYRDKLIRELSKPRCNRKCGFLLGVGAAVLIRQAAK